MLCPDLILVTDEDFRPKAYLVKYAILQQQHNHGVTSIYTFCKDFYYIKMI